MPHQLALHRCDTIRRSQPREQFLGDWWFGNEIVRAVVQSLNAFRVLVVGGHQNDVERPAISGKSARLDAQLYSRHRWQLGTRNDGADGIVVLNVCKRFGPVGK